MTGIPVDIQRK